MPMILVRAVRHWYGVLRVHGWAYIGGAAKRCRVSSGRRLAIKSLAKSDWLRLVVLIRPAIGGPIEAIMNFSKYSLSGRRSRHLIFASPTGDVPVVALRSRRALRARTSWWSVLSANCRDTVAPLEDQKDSLPFGSWSAAVLWDIHSHCC